MKKEQTEELFVKWVDGRLSNEEQSQLDELFAADPELEAELTGAREVAAVLQSEIPKSVEPPYPDFFNSQLMRKVDLEIAAQRPAEKAARWWESLRWAWAPVGALALVLAFFAGQRMSPQGNSGLTDRGAADSSEKSEELPNVYFAEKSLTAEVIADADGNVSAIVVEGIAAISDDIDFSRADRTTGLPARYLQSEERRLQ